MWQQADSVAGMTWEEALAHAEGLELAGHTRSRQGQPTAVVFTIRVHLLIARWFALIPQSSTLET
jgi:hypothetical protein